jgi:hypothetical protein
MSSRIAAIARLRDRMWWNVERSAGWNQDLRKASEILLVDFASGDTQIDQFADASDPRDTISL